MIYFFMIGSLFILYQFVKPGKYDGPLVRRIKEGWFDSKRDKK